MNKYELVVVINGLLPQDQAEKISKQAEEIIVKGGGKVLSSKLWIEKHKPDFKIKGCQELNYYLIEFEMDASGIAKVKTALKLNENILRDLITKSKNIMAQSG